MEESNKKLPNFTFGFEGDLAMLQASKGIELQQSQKQLISLK